MNHLNVLRRHPWKNANFEPAPSTPAGYIIFEKLLKNNSLSKHPMHWSGYVTKDVLNEPNMICLHVQNIEQ